MASGWSWFVAMVLILQAVIAEQTSVITVQEGEPYNVSCSYMYSIPVGVDIWDMTPQLVNTHGEGECIPSDSVSMYTCYINSAKLADAGMYVIELSRVLTSNGQLMEGIHQCNVIIEVHSTQTAESSSIVETSTSLITTSSSFPTTTTIHVSTSSAYSTLIRSTSSTAAAIISVTNTAVPAPGQGTSIIVIVVPAIVVGLLLSLSLIICSVVAFIIVIKPRRNQYSQEASDSGFLIGKERKELFESSCNDGQTPQTIPFVSILFQELIDKSEYTLVHHATIRGVETLVKQLRESSSKFGRDELLHEITLLKDLTDRDAHHLNIISFIGTTVAPDPLCLAVEYLPNGSLHDLLQALHKGPIPRWYMEHVANSSRGLYTNKQIAEDLFAILLQIAKGAQHLEDQGLVHGHLSTRKVLLGRRLIAKLSDFTVGESGDYFKKTGRETYLNDMAPEVISEGEHSIQSDVWSFGILMYRMATFETLEPFTKIKPHLVHAHIIQGMRPPPLPCYSKELYFQMQQCWKIDRDARPNFTQLIHTLEILAQSSWSHFLFEISEKRKSYVSENHEIHLFPPPSHFMVSNKRILFGNGKRMLPRVTSRSPDSNDTSGCASNSEFSSDTDQKGSDSKSGGYWGWWKRKKSSEVDTPVSHLLVSQKSVPKIEEFERNLLMDTKEVSRTNPLADSNA